VPWRRATFTQTPVLHTFETTIAAVNKINPAFESKVLVCGGARVAEARAFAAKQTLGKR